MAQNNLRNSEDPTAEILATSGLIMMLGALMTAVIAVVALGEGNAATAGIFGAVAVLVFVSSLVCFAMDSRRSEGAPLPFPSWLRTDVETAAELSGP